MGAGGSGVRSLITPGGTAMQQSQVRIPGVPADGVSRLTLETLALEVCSPTVLRSPSPPFSLVGESRVRRTS